MSSIHIFWPVFAQIFLTLMLFIILGARKANSLKAGSVDRKQAALDNRKWPDDVLKVSNNIANQFEIPILFYILCLVFYSINAVGIFAIILAWIFTISRYIHAYIHIGKNYVPMRLKAFMLGTLVLLTMLILLGWELAMRSLMAMSSMIS